MVLKFAVAKQVKVKESPWVSTQVNSACGHNACIHFFVDWFKSKTLMFTYHLPWCVAGTISVGGRSTGKWTTADTWIIFKVYDCKQRKYWKRKRKHKEERKYKIYVVYKKCGPKLIFFNEFFTNLRN